jgi:hypothetical protein
MVVDDGRGHTARATLSGATAVRIVPLMGGNPHAATGGYQVALRYSSGDAALGTPLADWRLAHELAQRVCEVSELPLDEMTERMFSRVDQASSKPEG